MGTPHPPSPQGRPASPPAAPNMEARRRVEGRLERSGYSALRRLRCEYHEGILRLSGVVPSYHLKQVALAVVAGAEGIRAISDEIEVVLGPATRMASDRLA